MATDIDRWIEASEALDEDEIVRELEELQDEARRLAIEIQKREDALEVKRRWARPGESGEGAGAGLRHTTPRTHNPFVTPQTPRLPLDGNGSAAAAPKSRREAVLALLGENPDHAWKLAEIRAAMVERGWLAPDDSVAHSLGVVVSKMARSGEIARPQTGYYQLRPDNGSAEP